ncbi:MAG TPA: substrate-binding domain-containing protein [Caulobacteraceae bacterium]|jgi:molybdate transport system substrate-binding protein
MTTTLSGISSMATRLILGELGQRYEAAKGVTVSIASMGGVDAAKRVREGEATDIVILASGPMAKLEAEGHLVAGSVKGFTRSGMAIAVPAAAARPDIGDEAAVKAAVLAAGKVCYSTGPSGDHLLQLCERWGIKGDSDKLLKAPPGIPVGSLVAQGQADLGFQQLSELIHVPGIVVLGPLPPEIQNVTVFAAGVASMSTQPEMTANLIAYLASPETAEVKQAQGMEAA